MKDNRSGKAYRRLMRKIKARRSGRGKAQEAGNDMMKCRLFLLSVATRRIPYVEQTGIPLTSCTAHRSWVPSLFSRPGN